MRQAGDLHGALELLESGVRIVESLRTKVAEEELRASFLASKQDFYEALHRHPDGPPARAGPGPDAEALQVSERARAAACWTS